MCLARRLLDPFPPARKHCVGNKHGGGVGALSLHQFSVSNQVSYRGAGSSYPHPPRMDSLRIVRRRRLWVTAGGGAFLRLVATRLIDVFLQHVDAILKSRTLVANNRILALFFRRSERARRSLLRTSSSRSHTGSNSVLISSRSRMRNASMCFSSSAMQRTSHRRSLKSKTVDNRRLRRS